MTEQEKIKKAIRHFECMRNDAVAVLDSGFGTHDGESSLVYDNRKMYAELAISALEKQIKGGWIPVTYHETTDDDGIDKLLYPVCLDCHMPDDEEEIIVCTKKYVFTDICCHDDGYSLDSGNDWIDDIIAWQPLPEPYKAN